MNRKLATAVGGTTGAIAAVVLTTAVVAACGSIASTSTSGHGISTTAPAAAPAPSAPPAANPDGKVTGSCDVSLSDSLYGQDYLTAGVDVQNTGNIGETVKVTVKFPQQGFAPITVTKMLRVPWGQTRTANIHYAAPGSVIDRFQSRQLASSAYDVCHYRGDLVSTFGTAHS